MARKAAVSPVDEAPVESPTRKKVFTPEPTQGGRIGEDGTVLERPSPEPDAQRLQQPENN